MDRVLDRLWIGSAEDFPAAFNSLGFVGVLDLRDSSPSNGPEDVIVHRLQNRDGDPWNEKQVNEALDFIQSRIRIGKVLVACAAGMSRSASMVIGYLVRSGWSVAEAYTLLKSSRPRILPMPKMLNSVLKVVQS